MSPHFEHILKIAVLRCTALSALCFIGDKSCRLLLFIIPLILILCKESHDEVYHHFLFDRLGFCYHDRQRDKRVVGYPLGAVLTQQKTVALEEVEKESRRDALVAVREAVVLCDEVEKVRGLLLCRRIKILTAKRLVHRAKGGLEGAVLLVAEKRGIGGKLHAVDELPAFLVG